MFFNKVEGREQKSSGTLKNKFMRRDGPNWGHMKKTTMSLVTRMHLNRLLSHCEVKVGVRTKPIRIKTKIQNEDQ